MKSSKAMDDYLAVERGLSPSRAAPFPTPSEVASAKGALSEDELSALRSRGTYTALGEYPEGWGPIPVDEERSPAKAGSEFWASFYGLKDAMASLERIKAEARITAFPITAAPIRYEWRASAPDADSLNVLFADGWGFQQTASVAIDGLSADSCLRRRGVP